MSKFKTVFFGVWIALCNVSDIYGFATSVFEKVTEIGIAHVDDQLSQPTVLVRNDFPGTTSEQDWFTGTYLAVPTSPAFALTAHHYQLGLNVETISFTK